jgi:hypothetical protein
MTVPTMQIRHDSNDRWWVAAKWPDGRTEDIEVFKSEGEANTWIVDELDRWLETRIDGHASET